MPRMMWHEDTGEARVFQDNETHPLEFIDHHPGDEAKRPAPVERPKPKAKPLTKAEVTKALDEGGVEYSADASVAALTEKLVASMKTYLTDNGVSFPDDAAPRELLELVEGNS